MAKSRSRLFREDDLGVLWLTAGRAELALSSDGIWLKTRRQKAELLWSEIEQLQQADVRKDRARVEIFLVDGSAYSVGPFPAAQGQRWVRAAGDAAFESGCRPRGLSGAVGFALPPDARRR
jgi:hypothetical protein